MKLTYTKQGDYLIPDITIRQPRKALGHYGRLRKTYLQNFRPILFNELVFSDMLFEHCLEIEETARDRIDVIMSGLMKQLCNFRFVAQFLYSNYTIKLVNNSTATLEYMRKVRTVFCPDFLAQS